MKRVVVVGGGIAGAAAAHELRTRRPDLEVTLLEGSPRIGGKLALAEVGGVTTDVGAEAVLQRRPEGVALIRDSGLGGDLVHPATISASLWNRGVLRPMPRTLMGVPGDLSVLAGLVDPVPEQTRVPPVDDVSVGDLVAEHLGEEVVQRLVEPTLGGVYAGHAHELSARAAVPALMANLDGTRTLVEAAAASMTIPDPAAPPVFAGIRGGVARLPVAAASVATVRTDATVRSLRRTTDGWALEVGSTRDPEEVRADAVVLATPAAPTSRLLADVAPAASAELAAIEYASMAVVTLAFRAVDLPATRGSGFLVPPVDGRSIKGATYSFAKWQWVTQAGGDVRLLRASVGRHREEQVLQRSDDELVTLVLRDLADAIGLSAVPVDAHVKRWGGGLPQYAVGHVERAARIRADVARVPGLAVCGAAYDGVGIPAVIGSAHRAVDVLLADTMDA